MTAKNVSNSKKYFMIESSVQTSDIFVDML